MNIGFFAPKRLLLILIICQACKKNETQSEVSKIFNPVNTIWWGSRSKGNVPGYFAMQFNADNRLTLVNEIEIDSNGIWFIKNNRIFMQDHLIGLFSAEINDSSHLINFVMMDDPPYFSINFAKRFSNSVPVKFADIKWAGAVDQDQNELISIIFTQSQLTMKIGTSVDIPVKYKEILAGRGFRATNAGLSEDHLFGLQISDSILIGSFNHGGLYIWKAKIQ